MFQEMETKYRVDGWPKATVQRKFYRLFHVPSRSYITGRSNQGVWATRAGPMQVVRANDCEDELRSGKLEIHEFSLGEGDAKVVMVKW